MMKKFGLFCFLLLVSAFPIAYAAEDCYRNCMIGAGCWDSMGESGNQAFCIGMQTTCTTECRYRGGSSYGAIAYSTKNGSYGSSDGQENQYKAQQTALQYCKKNGKGCKIMVWFYDSCGAVAADKGKTGWGRASSEAEAKQQALAGCKKSGGKNCEVKISHCST